MEGVDLAMVKKFLGVKGAWEWTVCEVYVFSPLTGLIRSDSSWENAKEYSEEDVGPKQPFYDADFAGATFIWSDDLKLDNVVAFRTVVESPPDGKAREDFTGLNDVVPEQPARGPGGGKGRQQGKGKQR